MRRAFVCVISLLFFLSCGKENSSIPQYAVYLQTTYSDYEELRPANRCIEYRYDNVYAVNTQLGFGGVAIARDLDGRLLAFDLACPYEHLRSVTVEVKMPFAYCKECGSKYDLSYGQCVPVAGPSKECLLLYTTIRDNGSSILVRN